VTGPSGQTVSLPPQIAGAVAAAAREWAASGGPARLWAKDASLWTGADEGRWMGWLHVPAAQRGRAAEWRAFGEEVRAAGFRHVLLLGMGGSSLCPEVWATTFGPQPGWPELHILDSTDPAQVRAAEMKVDLPRTLVMVASKSGSTLEPNIFMAYFLERMRRAAGADAVGSHFVAITDPGSTLEKIAGEKGFRKIFHGDPSIGGRYSALSAFGLAPAAAMGLDVARLLDPAVEMAAACAPDRSPADNPGIALGLVVGAAARLGHDKLTFIISPSLYDLGAWLEQLVAESTGKQGHGVIPVDLEIPAEAPVYGRDRLFVQVRDLSAPDAAQDRVAERLRASGQPLVKIEVADRWRLGAEFYRWEVATATAGAVIGINPFDQPDVEASKIETRKLTDAFERDGALAEEQPALEDSGIRLYAPARDAAALSAAGPGLSRWLRAHVARLGPGDYFALLAYIEMTAAHQAILQEIRHEARSRMRAATCLGFGPRFLHSTGQAYKGGPNTGVFLQITGDDAADLPVPGQKYTFGVVKAAQAQGDLAVLAARGRRVLRAHLGADIAAGLRTLLTAVRATD